MENTPYPPCQVKASSSGSCSLIQREELRLTSLIRSEIVCVRESAEEMDVVLDPTHRDRRTTQAVQDAAEIAMRLRDRTCFDTRPGPNIGREKCCRNGPACVTLFVVSRI